MTEAELASQLDALEKLLDEVSKMVEEFERRIDQAETGIKKVETAVPKLDAVLALTANAQTSDETIYKTVAEALFAPFNERLEAADAALDISFDPAQALSGLTEQVQGTLGDVMGFASDSAEEFDAFMDSLESLIDSTIVEDVQTAVAGWQTLSEEAEEQVAAASDAFEEVREFSTESLEADLKDRLEEIMGARLTKVSKDIEAVFDSAEDVLDKADGLVSDGVGEVTETANKVMEIQQGIQKIRPLLEILM